MRRSRPSPGADCCVGRHRTLPIRPWLAIAAALLLFLGGLAIGRQGLIPQSAEDGRSRFALFLYEGPEYDQPAPEAMAQRVREYVAWATEKRENGVVEGGEKLREDGTSRSSRMAGRARPPRCPASSRLAGYFVVQAERSARGGGDRPHLPARALRWSNRDPGDRADLGERRLPESREHRSECGQKFLDLRVPDRGGEGADAARVDQDSLKVQAEEDPVSERRIRARGVADGAHRSFGQVNAEQRAEPGDREQERRPRRRPGPAPIRRRSPAALSRSTASRVRSSSVASPAARLTGFAL